MSINTDEITKLTSKLMNQATLRKYFLLIAFFLLSSYCLDQTEAKARARMREYEKVIKVVKVADCDEIFPQGGELKTENVKKK